jgi:hypothetical protein
MPFATGIVLKSSLVGRSISTPMSPRPPGLNVDLIVAVPFYLQLGMLRLWRFAAKLLNGVPWLGFSSLGVTKEEYPGPRGGLLLRDTFAAPLPDKCWIPHLEVAKRAKVVVHYELQSCECV